MFFLIDENLKIIFGWSAKCGCSHIKKIYWFLITNNNDHIIHFKDNREKNKLPNNIEEYKTILIIRNPYERIISGFLDKYKDSGEFRWMWKKDTLTFSNFVNEVIINNWKFIEYHHFIPQTNEQFNKQHILKSKELKIYDIKDIDYSYIENLYQKKIPQNVINFKGDHIRKAIIPFENHVFDLFIDEYIDYKISIDYFYNEDIKEKIYNYYKNDFDFFQLYGFNYKLETIKINTILPIKIINLEHRTDRKESTIKELEKHNVTNYEFIKAVDGKKLESSLELKKLFEGNKFNNRRGVIGCALSHLNLWKELVDDSKNYYYIIMEDDFTLCDDFLSKLKSLELKNKDLIYLGYHMYEINRNKVRNIYDNNNSNIIITDLNKNLNMGGTFCYSINKNGAKKLIDYINKNKILEPIDNLIHSSLKCYEAQPQLVFSEFVNMIPGKNVDSDIQGIYDCLDFNEDNHLLSKFIFIPELDQSGYDIYYKKTNIKELLIMANEDENCIAFNTLGFFKNNIEKLTKSIYFKKNDGIYIKKEYLLKIKTLNIDFNSFKD